MRHRPSAIVILEACIEMVSKAQAISDIVTLKLAYRQCVGSYTQDMHIVFVQGTCNQAYLYLRHAYRQCARHRPSAIFILRHA